ncbi:LPS assembly lipoprotein LptE, partial [Falsiroseomonas oryzae]|uniref:LPS assembly lipoprotein LptE n=1 Tax=Falsiroseomonas oryzae TaxID=2766473 RepID=UPI0022EABE25
MASELAATRVPVIPQRFGQLVRRGLQQRLGSGAGVAESARWELTVAPSLTGEGLGIQSDGSATRLRFIATANWRLARVGAQETVASGFERVIDASNVLQNQYFASEASRDAADFRMAELLADEVVTRVALQFRALQAGAAAQAIAPVQPPPSLPELRQPPGPGGPAIPLPGT